MEVIQCKEDIISYVAGNACNKISKRVVRELQKMTEDLLAGDDSGLKNIWDEVCVQIRHQYSIYWDFYVTQIESIISDELEKLDSITKRAIWLQTDQGKEWAEEEEEYQNYLKDQDFREYCSRRLINPDTNDYDIVDFIMSSFVLSAAANWTNKRIGIYLDRDYE